MITTEAPIALSVSQRLVRLLTRLQVALPAVILSLALLTWSAVTAWPAKNLTVHARGLSIVETNMAVSAEAVAELEIGARTAALQLVRDREEIARMLSRLEQRAHALGFQVEVSSKPAVTNAAGFKELTIHSALFSLDNDSDHDGPAFVRLLSWLGEVSQLGRKVEVAALSLRSKGDALARAQVELNFWSIKDHGQPAAK